MISIDQKKVVQIQNNFKPEIEKQRGIALKKLKLIYEKIIHLYLYLQKLAVNLKSISFKPRLL